MWLSPRFRHVAAIRCPGDAERNAGSNRHMTHVVESSNVHGRVKKEDSGGYSVRCVELPAAIIQGETEEEAIRNVKEAIELVLEELERVLRRRNQTSWNS